MSTEIIVIGKIAFTKEMLNKLVCSDCGMTKHPAIEHLFCNVKVIRQ